MDKNEKLKRLEQENEELQGKYNGLNTNYNSLKFENERLKEEINRNGREWENHCNAQYWQMQSIIDKYRQALQEIREIIDFRFKTSYMTLGFKEYDELIEDIDKIVIEVIGAE